VHKLHFGLCVLNFGISDVQQYAKSHWL
jgi:hypothetical protein